MSHKKLCFHFLEILKVFSRENYTKTCKFKFLK